MRHQDVATITTTAPTVTEYVERYGLTRGIEAETVRQYEIAARRFEQFAGDGIRVNELDELTVSAWVAFLTRSCAPATVRSKRNQILALWRAAADDYLCEPPRRRVRVAMVPWTPRECWTIDEVRELVRAAGSLHRWHPCGLRRSEWWPLAIRLAWDTGLRWGDLVRLRFTDIEGGIVTVCQHKTRRPHMAVLHPTTLAALDASRTHAPRELVVPWTASQKTFLHQVRRLVRKAGIRPGTWRWLRRGGASDVEIQQPGSGQSSRHLGHRPGSNIAPLHYLDPKVIAASVPMVAPRDLGDCA